jgi:hypothetical protein
MPTLKTLMVESFPRSKVRSPNNVDSIFRR